MAQNVSKKNLEKLKQYFDAKSNSKSVKKPKPKPLSN